jgi:hypothetical protein
MVTGVTADRSRKACATAPFLILHAAFSGPEEARELLEFLPKYGRFPSLMPRVWLIRLGGAGLLRLAYHVKLRLRQMAKKFLYKKPPGHPSPVPGGEKSLSRE